MNPKIQSFQNFQKLYHMLFSYYSSTSVQNFKSIAPFLTPKWSVFVSEIIPNYDVIFQMRFFVPSGGRTQKQMTLLDS